MNATAVQQHQTTPEAPAIAPRQASRAGVVRRRSLPVQFLLTVGRPDDPLEHEAAGFAARVQGASAPTGAAVGSTAAAVQPLAAVRRVITGPRPTTMAGLPAGDGEPMRPAVRDSIEPHLGIALDSVRVHTGPEARRAAAGLGARAFTHRDQIFLGPRESADDVGLMAHEAAHVVQQGASDSIHLLPGFITRWAADFARMIPGYEMMTLIVGYDPIADVAVERTPTAVLSAFIGLAPGGSHFATALAEAGILTAAADFVAAQLVAHDLTGARIWRMVDQAISEMEVWRWDALEYNYDIIAGHLAKLWADICSFASTVANAVLQMIKDAVAGLAERLLAGNPAWSLLTKILGRDPLRGTEVKVPMTEIVEDFLRLIGREQELEEMRKRGTLEKTAAWLATQLGTFGQLFDQLGALFSSAWAAIQPSNLPNMLSDLEALAGQVGTFLRGVWDFATTVARTVLTLIKDALLGWLSGFAHELPGFHLVTVILGRNPFTGEPVQRTAVNVIKGFITLLPGGEAQYEQLAESGVVGESAARIEGAMSELGITWELVRDTFLGVWNSLSIQDLVEPIAAFERIRAQFGVPIAKLFAFVQVVLKEILTLVLAMMNFPADVVVRIITNAMQAYEDIKRDPVGFLLNMLRAVKTGFGNFFGKILNYLSAGLTSWLFRGLRQAGIEPPQELTLESVLDLVVKILGITTEKLWAKLAKRIGQDKVDQIRKTLDKLEGIWTFVRDVQERGVSAVWERVQTQLGNLWDMVVQKVRSWIMEKIVDRVVAKLLSMLDPTGVMAVVNSFVAFFNAVQSALEYAREILLIVDDYVSTLASVARGDVEPGAVKIEQGLAGAVPVAIGFLANQVGLGNIGEKLAEILADFRVLVDKALDWFLDQAVKLGQAVLKALGGSAGQSDETDLGFDISEGFEEAGQQHTVHNNNGSSDLVIESPKAIAVKTVPDAEIVNAFKAYRSKIATSGLSVDERKKLAKAAILEIIKCIRAAGLLRKPGHSAPGIGEIRWHKDQQTRLRGPGLNAVKVWRLESEHVIPRAFVDTAFVAMGLPGVLSGSVDYDRMTTILVYWGAAKLKTEGAMGDLSIIPEYKDAVAELVATPYSAKSGAAAKVGHFMKSQVGKMLDSAAGDAVTRMNLAIEMENSMNGHARGPETNREPPTPGPAEVGRAVKRQSDDIRQQLNDRFEEMFPKK